MEWWSNEKGKQSLFYFQHSNTPLLHYSNTSLQFNFTTLITK